MSSVMQGHRYYTITSRHMGFMGSLKGSVIQNLERTIIPEYRFLRTEGEWSVFQYRDTELFVRTACLVLSR